MRSLFETFIRCVKRVQTHTSERRVEPAVRRSRRSRERGMAEVYTCRPALAPAPEPDEGEAEGSWAPQGGLLGILMAITLSPNVLSLQPSAIRVAYVQLSLIHTCFYSHQYGYSYSSSYIIFTTRTR